MDGGNLQQKIQYGYYKCAVKVGATFLLYRSTTPINPIQFDNLIGIIPMSSNVSWDYMKTNKYGNAVWNLIINCQVTRPPFAAVGDYLIPTVGYIFNICGYGVNYTCGYNIAGCYSGNYEPFEDGFTEDPNIYFVGQEQFLLPILGVKCNRLINIIRPSQTLGAGFQGYAEYLPSTSEVIMTAMPCSILEVGAEGGMAVTKLPTDTNEPRWIILIPNLGGVIVRVDDIVIDDFDQEYVITDNEATELGWRLLANQVVNSR